MPNYRRIYESGATYFFTVVTGSRAPLLEGSLARQLLRDALTTCRQRHPFRQLAFVTMPDHLHTIWVLPPDDPDFSRRWSYLKSEFTRAWLCLDGRESPKARQPSDRRRGAWQRRFWEHLIRDERDFELHINYIHYNPVKHGMASCPHAWADSSFTHWVRRGVYPNDWCCRCVKTEITPPDFAGLSGTAME